MQVNHRDSELLTPDFLRSVQSRLSQMDVAGDLEIGPPVAIIGGVIVGKDGGRVLFDNSFEGRIERQMWTLRNVIWQILGGGEEMP